MKNISKIFSLVLFPAFILISSMNMALFYPHEIHLAEEFKTSILSVDIVMFAFMAACALFLPVWGFFCDAAGREGRKFLLFLGTGIWSAASIALYGASSYSALFFFRLISGIGIAVMYPISFSIIADHFPPEKRGTAIAAIPIMIALGTGGGVILANAFGGSAWRPPFLILGVIGFLFIALSFFFLNEPERGMSEPELKELIQSGKNYLYKINPGKIANSLKVGTNRWILFSHLTWSINLGVISYKIIPYLNIYGFDAAAAAIIFILIGSGIVLGYALGGLVGDRSEKHIGRVTVSAVSLFVSVFFLLAAWFIPRPEILWSFNTYLTLFLSFFGLALAFFNVPNIYALLAEVNEPETRGMLFSILNSIAYFAMGFGVLIAGFKTEATLYSYQRVLAGGTLAYLLTILAWLPLFKTVKKDRARIREILSRRAREMNKPPRGVEPPTY